MKIRKATWVIVALVLLVALVGGFMLYRSFYGITTNGLAVPPAGSITIRGKLACLPHKQIEGAMTVNTRECAIGFKDAGGHYYSLPYPKSNVALINTSGETVTISGTFVPDTVDNGPGTEVYDTVGSIKEADVR